MFHCKITWGSSMRGRGRSPSWCRSIPASS